MEALAALSLACNVVQLVDFSLKTASEIHEIYRKGATSDTITIQSTSQQLEYLGKVLDKSIDRSQAANSSKRHEKELQLVARRCSKTAGALNTEVLKLRSSGGRRDVLKKFFRSVKQANTIKNLEAELQGYERVLDTSLLMSLRESAAAIFASQKEDFTQLDGKLQAFIFDVNRGILHVTDLVSAEAVATRDLIVAESLVTRSHITASVRQKQDVELLLASQTAMETMDKISDEGAAIRDHVTELQAATHNSDRCRLLLTSLTFPEIRVREETIEEPHRKTFEWIFHEPEETKRPWSNFLEWLRTGSDVYWINGKAGSGKSTLMNFICSDTRLKSLLLDSSHATILKFFFWNPGTALQKSLEGLMRSLLCQVLQSLPQESSLWKKISTEAATNPGEIVWSFRLLRKWLLSALQSLPGVVLIFLDGLDEFHDFGNQICDFIEDLKELSTIKLCVSSRPSVRFEVIFRNCSSLKLQDLTRHDIELYVEDELKRNWSFNQSLLKHPNRCIDLVHRLVSKADGVFLWVKLVMRYLAIGLINQDDYSQLEERPEIIPSEMQNLYKFMLGKNAKESGIKSYQDKARLYFDIMMVGRQGLSVLDMTLAVSHDLQHTCLEDASSVDMAELQSRCERTRVGVTTCCAGLLEVVLNDDDDLQVKPRISSSSNVNVLHAHSSTLSNLYAKTSIRFFHRTAYEFLLQSEGSIFASDDHEAQCRAASMVYRALHVRRLLECNVDDPEWIGDTIITLKSFQEEGLFTSDLVDKNLGLTEEVCKRLIAISRHQADPQEWYRSQGRSVIYWNTRLPCIDFLSFIVLNFPELSLKRLRADPLRCPEYLSYLLLHLLYGIAGINLSSCGQPRDMSLIQYLIANGANRNTTLAGQYFACLDPWTLFLWSTWVTPWSHTLGIYFQEVAKLFLDSGSSATAFVPLLPIWADPDFDCELGINNELKVVIQTNGISLLRLVLGPELLRDLEASYGLENEGTHLEPILSCLDYFPELLTESEEIILTHGRWYDIRQQPYAEIIKDACLTSYDERPVMLEDLGIHPKYTLMDNGELVSDIHRFLKMGGWNNSAIVQLIWLYNEPRMLHLFFRQLDWFVY